jgi:SOS-response transcriptional repressor LexA
MLRISTEEVGKRIKQGRQERGWTIKRLADEVKRRLPDADAEKINDEVVRSWEKSHVKLHRHPQRAQAVAEALDMTLDELIEGKSRTLDAIRRMRRIAVLGDLAAGDPDGAYGNEEWIEVEDWETPRERWGRRIRGESMLPILKPRDICIFEDRSAEAGDIIHAYDQGVDTIKVYRRRQGQPWLEPANPEFDPIDATKWNVRGPLMEVHRFVGGVKLILKSTDGSPLRPADLEPFAST